MKREKLNNDKITALYCGLSKDDGTNNESISISTQKTMLKDYAKRNGFLNCQFMTVTVVQTLEQCAKDWLFVKLVELTQYF